MQDITAEQIKGARAMLGWTTAYLANITGIGIATLKRYEAVKGIPKSRKGHLKILRRNFEAAGIEFIGTPDNAPGIRIHALKDSPS